MPTLTDLDPAHVIRSEFTILRLQRTLGIKITPNEGHTEVQYEEGADSEFTTDAVKAVVLSDVKESTFGKKFCTIFEMPMDSVGWATGKQGEFLDYCDHEIPHCLVLYRNLVGYNRDVHHCIILSTVEHSRISAELLIKTRIECTLPGSFTARETEKSFKTKEPRIRVFQIKNREAHVKNIARDIRNIRELIPKEVAFEMMGSDNDKWFYIWGPGPQRSSVESLIRGAYFGDASEAQNILSDYTDDVITVSCPESYNIVQRSGASYTLQSVRKKYRCVLFSYYDKQNNKKIAIMGTSFKKRLATSTFIKADIEESHPGHCTSNLTDQKATHANVACDTFRLFEGEKKLPRSEVETASGASIAPVGNVLHIVGDLVERKRARSYISLFLSLDRNGSVDTDTSGVDILTVKDIGSDRDQLLNMLRDACGVAIYKIKIDGKDSVIIAGSTEDQRKAAELALNDKLKQRELENKERDARRLVADNAFRLDPAFWRTMPKLKRDAPYDDNRRRFNDRPSGDRWNRPNRPSSGGGNHNQRGRDSYGGPGGSNYTKFPKRY